MKPNPKKFFLTLSTALVASGILHALTGGAGYLKEDQLAVSVSRSPVFDTLSNSSLLSGRIYVLAPWQKAVVIDKSIAVSTSLEEAIVVGSGSIKIKVDNIRLQAIYQPDPQSLVALVNEHGANFADQDISQDLKVLLSAEFSKRGPLSLFSDNAAIQIAHQAKVTVESRYKGKLTDVMVSYQLPKALQTIKTEFCGVLKDVDENLTGTGTISCRF